MFASIVIVILAVLLGGLSIFAQFTNRERREQLRVLETPTGAIVFAAIFWLVQAHLDVDALALKIALVAALLIPAATYAFSPARKDAKTHRSQHANRHQASVRSHRSDDDCHHVLGVEDDGSTVRS